MHNAFLVCLNTGISILEKEIVFKNPKLFLTVLLYIHLAYTFTYFQTKGKRR